MNEDEKARHSRIRQAIADGKLADMAGAAVARGLLDLEGIPAIVEAVTVNDPRIVEPNATDELVVRVEVDIHLL